MCELPGASNRAMNKVICDHCGKKRHEKENCRLRKREEREAAYPGGKKNSPPGGVKGGGKKGGKKGDEKGKRPKGGGKGKGKGKDKRKKKQKGARARSADSNASEDSSTSGEETRDAGMFLRLGDGVRALSPCPP